MRVLTLGLVLLTRTSQLANLTPSYLFLYLGWKSCYSSCGRVWNLSMSEVKCEKLLLYLQGEVQGAAAAAGGYVTVLSVMHGWRKRVKACCEFEYCSVSRLETFCYLKVGVVVLNWAISDLQTVEAIYQIEVFDSTSTNTHCFSFCFISVLISLIIFINLQINQ